MQVREFWGEPERDSSVMVRPACDSDPIKLLAQEKLICS